MLGQQQRSSRQQQLPRRACIRRLSILALLLASFTVLAQLVSYYTISSSRQNSRNNRIQGNVEDGLLPIKKAEAVRPVARVEEHSEICLGMASKISLAEVAVFVKSFRQTAPRARLILFIDKETLKTHLDLLKNYDVETVVFDVDKDLPGAAKKFHPSNYRWLMLRDHLRRIRPDRFSKILLIDVRDSMFQRNPFDIIPGEQTGIWMSLEAGGPIVNCGWNKGWVQDCFGDEVIEKIGMQKISCSGVVLGRAEAIQQYLNLMADELESRASCERNGVDQGVHNVLLWTNRLPEVHLIKIDDGLIAHIQAMPAHDADIRDSVVLAANARPEPIPFAIVHQYDRRPDLTALFRRLYNAE